jgi:biotin carboxyl carrier protein
MKFLIKIGEKEYPIEVLEGEEEVKIKVGEKEFLFKKKEKIFFPKTKFEKREFKEKKILAPIAGTISEIFVKEGDFIKEKQKVFLLSAMKMENEIFSDFEGRVKKIFVKKGENVKKDQILLIGE